MVFIFILPILGVKKDVFSTLNAVSCILLMLKQGGISLDITKLE
jgi:hypothetical protein